MSNLTTTNPTDLTTIDPSSAWIYSGGLPRLSINNSTRNGFVIKTGGEITENLPELNAVIRSVVTMNSHRNNPNNANEPKHVDSVEWCESRNNLQSSTRDVPCNECPAIKDCRWKIEVRLALPDHESEYLLTLPTASSVRFRQFVQRLAQTHNLHFQHVIFRMWVTVEKNKNDEDFPIVNFEALDPETAAPIDVTIPKREQVAATIQQASKVKAIPAKGLNIKVNGTTWAKFVAQVAALPYYQNANPTNANYHIVGAIKKLGYTTVEEQDLADVFNKLVVYAEENKAA